MIRLLISGGPGSGCTSTALALSRRLSLPAFDSDTYFHKPTDPPFQETYTLDERRALLRPLLGCDNPWILSGSVAAWGLDFLRPTHGLFLDIPTQVRLARLQTRQEEQFGARIEPGAELREEHLAFLDWAAEYETRSDFGRNLVTDQSFLATHCANYFHLKEVQPLDAIVDKVIHFLADTTS